MRVLKIFLFAAAVIFVNILLFLQCFDAFSKWATKTGRFKVKEIYGAPFQNLTLFRLPGHEADYLFGKKLEEEEDSETVRFWNRLGLVAKGNGDFQKSKYFYLSALKLRPQAKEVNFNIAMLLYEQGEYDSSMAYTTKALRLYPDFAEAKELRDSIQKKMDQIAP